jgi:hypothetical protein
MAIGARMRLTTNGGSYLRYVNGGNGFASQSSTRVTFGLGNAAQISSLEVRWPSGLRQMLPRLAVDHYYRLVEGQSPTAFRPRRPKP